MALYEQFLQEQCKISFRMYVDKDSKVLKWRDLTGPEKCRLFKGIDIPSLFPRIPHATTVQRIWTEFQEIYGILQSNTPLDKDGVKGFQSCVRNWFTLFCQYTM